MLLFLTATESVDAKNESLTPAGVSDVDIIKPSKYV